MPRPQFILKTLLLWLVLLPAAVGALVGSLNAANEAKEYPLLFIAGALFGTCIGSYRSSSHAVLGAVFGAALAWPAFLVGLFVSILVTMLEIDFSPHF
jgi:hypothetical protein